MNALGDVYLDYPFEEMNSPEGEIAYNNVHFHEAISAGTVITRHEYFR